MRLLHVVSCVRWHNNNIHYILWLIVFTWYIWYNRHLIIYLILLLTALILFIYVLYIILVLFQYIFSLCFHMLYGRALFLYSYTFIRSLDSLDLHIQICGYFADKVFGENHRHLEDPGIFSIWLPILLLNFYLCWLYITFSCHFIPLFICYHVWTFICTVAVLSYYHSDI